MPKDGAAVVAAGWPSKLVQSSVASGLLAAAGGAELNDDHSSEAV